MATTAPVIADAKLNSDRVEVVYVGPATVWFAQHRAALLSAKLSLPGVARETLVSWEDDGRPLWVEFDEHRPWKMPRHVEPLADGRLPDLRPSPDLYGFDPPVSFGAPKWWLAAFRAWRKGQQR